MGAKHLSLCGQKFNRLTVISKMEKVAGKRLHWLCRCDCGKETSVVGYKLTSNHTRSCGCLKREKSSERMIKLGKVSGKINGGWNKGMRGEGTGHWKGGRKMHRGYILVLTEGSYQNEHRVVMEKHLGRKLTKAEVIHHINGVRTDNRLENLMLFPNHSEHMKHHNQLKK